nr:hypothetical protein [uncultured Draconibacterium sp.]
MDNFRPGKDSYYLSDGMYPHFNPWTGEKAFADIGNASQIDHPRPI